MSNLFDMRQTITSCVSRTFNSYNTGTLNFVDTAINNAVIYVQRKCDFEWNKGMVQVHCDPTGSIMSAKDLMGCPVQIKKVIKAMGLEDPGLQISDALPYLSRQNNIGDTVQQRQNRCVLYSNDEPRVIHDGQVLYHFPLIEGPYDLYFYAVKWLPRLVKEEDTNFLLQYGFDVIMYRAITELNFFIKEDERFSISTSLVADAWASLTAWDASLISPTETEIEL